jgi:hypothetical protein
MSYSTIYFIGLTVVFAIYYLALMYLDLKAKKEDKSDVETIDVPEPAPDAPPTEVEETDDGYVIRNGKNGTDGSNASSGSQNQGNAAHGDKADNVMSHIQSQFNPVKMQSDAEFTHEQMQLIMANGGDTSDGNKITQTRIRV